MTRLALTPGQSREAVELRAAGLAWATIARRLGCSLSAARMVVVRAGGVLAPSLHTGRPRGSKSVDQRLDLYRESLGRAWRSRGWSWRRLAAVLGVPASTVRRWCR